MLLIIGIEYSVRTSGAGNELFAGDLQKYFLTIKCFNISVRPYICAAESVQWKKRCNHCSEPKPDSTPHATSRRVMNYRQFFGISLGNDGRVVAIAVVAAQSERDGQPGGSIRKDRKGRD
jgi:hypothetical protein